MEKETKQQKLPQSHFVKAYKWAAITLLNIIVVFIITNVLIGSAYSIKDYFCKGPISYTGKSLFNEDGTPVNNGKRDLFQLTWFDFNACKELGEQYVSEILDDFHLLSLKGLIYQPWVQYVNPPYAGKRVNIIRGERGRPRRKTINPPRQKNKQIIRIFALGGSTTFGYLVSDEYTWPTLLSTILNKRAEKEEKPFQIEVINHGRNGYDPSQQSALFFDLIKNGHRPSLVISLDGTNLGEPVDEPVFTKEVEKLFLSGQFYECLELQKTLLKYKWLPIIRLIHSINKRIEGYNLSNKDESVQLTPTDNLTELKKAVRFFINRFEQNRVLIQTACSVYGIKSLFFLQPVACYKYNLNLFRPELRKHFAENDKIQVKIFYDYMRNNSDYIDISNLFEVWGKDKKAFVDDCHYSPAFNKFLAEQIANYINLDELKVFPKVIDHSLATGILKISTIKEDLHKAR